MKPSQKGIDLIKDFEQLVLKAYLDEAGVWTIGYGTIEYPDHRQVKKGDVITKADALECLQHEVDLKTNAVLKAIGGVNLTQNQFDALVSFTYNCGEGALLQSTLLKKLKINPNDPTIRDEFMKWNKVHRNGKVVSSKGLTIRRKKEADLYFS